MNESARRIEQLESRLALLEDHLAILQLVASYGPAVDSLDRDAVAWLWAEGGSYDFGGAPLVGRGDVAGLVDLPSHRAYVEAGCAHALAPPRVTITGDRAVAVGCSQVLLKDGNGWRVARTSANRWEFVRTSEGWKVLRRTNRLMDGSRSSRDLFRR